MRSFDSLQSPVPIPNVYDKRRFLLDDPAHYTEPDPKMV